MKLAWDETGKCLYETGADRGVLYKSRSKGVAWNGLSAVNETPSGAEPTALWANNNKYVTLMSSEELGLTIEAYTYPEEFIPCLGEYEISPGVIIGQQDREHFGFSYRTLLGNDESGNNYGYKIHLVYDCLASPSEKSRSSVNDSPDVSPFSWDVTTTPVEVEGHKSTSMLTIDSTKYYENGIANALRGIEEALYGTDKSDAWLPDISEIEEIVEYHRCVRDSKGTAITDSNGQALLSVVC